MGRERRKEIERHLTEVELDEADQARLRELLKADGPWTTQEIRQLIEEKFCVTYHPNYIHDFLRSLGLHYAKPRPERPERPDNAEAILDGRLKEALDNAENEEDDPITDGGYVVGFLTRRGRNRPTTASASGQSTSRE